MYAVVEYKKDNYNDGGCEVVEVDKSIHTVKDAADDLYTDLVSKIYFYHDKITLEDYLAKKVTPFDVYEF